MPSITTWQQLIASDLPMSGENLAANMLNDQFATITRPDDGLLHMDWGLILLSMIHPIEPSPGRPKEPMLVVQEGLIVPTRSRYRVIPNGHLAHYRTADALGLTGNDHDPSVHSVLVPVGMLHMISFTKEPELMRGWVTEILEGDPQWVESFPTDIES